MNGGDGIITTASDLGVESHTYIVGRGQGMIKPFALEWCSFDELVPLGDALPPSDFAQHASIPAVQHCHVSATKNNGIQQYQEKKDGLAT